MEMSLNRSIYAKAEAKTEENKTRVSGWIHAYAWTTLRAHNQAYVRSLDHAHVGFKTQILTT